MLTRIRHWRGRGIHSPFVYTLVRGGIGRAKTTDDVVRLLRTENVFVVERPYATRQRRDACLRVAASGERLTIDTRRVFIIFDREQQPKQHFRV